MFSFMISLNFGFYTIINLIGFRPLDVIVTNHVLHLAVGVLNIIK